MQLKAKHWLHGEKDVKNFLNFKMFNQNYKKSDKAQAQEV